jgi:hypothetical protein
MGAARWDPDNWATYARSTAGRSTAGIFTRAKLDSALDPRRCKVRESRDSKENPASNAIIVGLDVTGSMGMIADALARRGLGVLVEELLARKPVSDPHIMAMGIGDAWCDQAPLQVTQFEADIRIAEQLEKIYLEHGGGGNSFESYNLPWYFAATKTSIDCFEKRSRKGYLFTVGDEEPPPALLAAHAQQVMGATPQTDILTRDLLAMVQRTYHVFHVVVEEGDHARHFLPRVMAKWTDLLGQRVLRLGDHTKLAEVVVSAIQVNEGVDIDSVARSWSGSTALVVKRAVGGLTPAAGHHPAASGLVRL